VRAVVQRVSEARVAVEGTVVGQIGRGLCVLLGIGRDDTEAEAGTLCRKIVGLRVFDDEAGRFGARMALALVNDGPVTLVLDTAGAA
jgi:D-tyrosyl-tRNA(Tyr) deacylase